MCWGMWNAWPQGVLGNVECLATGSTGECGMLGPWCTGECGMFGHMVYWGMWNVWPQARCVFTHFLITSPNNQNKQLDDLLYNELKKFNFEMLQTYKECLQRKMKKLYLSEIITFDLFHYNST